MTEAEKRLKAQLDANTAAIQQMQRQAPPQQYAPEPGYDPYYSEPPMGYGPPPGDPYGAPVDPNKIIMQAITNQASAMAAKHVEDKYVRAKGQEENIKSRMKRLVSDFPALSEEGSDLVNKSREVYSRITQENPGLDEATKYELSVREAATLIGARPATIAPEDDSAWTMGSSTVRNPALPSKSTKSRLTPNIINNARAMGINVDPKTREGQQNLKELSEYSARFNADQDETAFRYR